MVKHCKADGEVRLVSKLPEYKTIVGTRHEAAHFLSQHAGGRGRQMSKFTVSLVYVVSSGTARAT